MGSGGALLSRWGRTRKRWFALFAAVFATCILSPMLAWSADGDLNAHILNMGRYPPKVSPVDEAYTPPVTSRPSLTHQNLEDVTQALGDPSAVQHILQHPRFSTLFPQPLEGDWPWIFQNYKSIHAFLDCLGDPRKCAPNQDKSLSVLLFSRWSSTLTSDTISSYSRLISFL